MPSWKDNPRVESLLRSGIDLKNRNDIAGAIAAFQQAIEEAPSCSVAYWLLGGALHYDRENPRAALPYFKKAVQLSPRTEKASLGLFHALWAIDRRDEALEEIKRFQLLTKGSCKDYLEIVAEINEKCGDEPQHKPQPKSVRRASRSRRTSVSSR